ncbi:unnamed protein product [Musa acuminata subsp. burmannicoides]
MSSSTKYADPTFQGVGHKVGTEIWCIENFQPLPIPKSDYGKFYSGDSYIILQTTGKVAPTFMTFTSGSEKSQAKMKLGLQQSRLSNLMQFLEVVQFNTGNPKASSLTSSCHTSNHALFLRKEDLPLDSRSLRRKSLKHGYTLVEENGLSE